MKPIAIQAPTLLEVKEPLPARHGSGAGAVRPALEQAARLGRTTTARSGISTTRRAKVPWLPILLLLGTIAESSGVVPSWTQEVVNIGGPQFEFGGRWKVRRLEVQLAQVSYDLDDLGGLEKYRYKADYTEVKRIYLQIFAGVVKRTFITMAEQLQQIREVLDGLTRNQEQNQWARNVKGPEVFKADTRETELKQWEDWKFTLESWVKAVDPEMYLDMKRVAQNAEEAIDWNELSDARMVKSLRLFGVLASYLRGRALKLIKHTPEENGYEAWRLLLRDMQPSTRQRALALMTQLSRITFAPNKSIMEQLPAYEALVREYERVSSQVYPEDLKVASILSACPVGVRAQLQMMVNEETTFESLKGRIEQYEAITTKWSTENVLGLPSQTSMEGPTPMDVDYIGGYQKGKKGKGKDGKGKYGKGKSKKGQSYNDFRVKGKSKDEKGKSKAKGKQDRGKGKAKEQCWNCGKPGHRSRECWAPRNINQVEGDWTNYPASPLASGTTGGGSTSGGATGAASSSAGTATVRMIRLVTPPDMNEMRMFDLTAGEDEFLGMIQEIDDESYSVLMVKGENDGPYYDAYEPVVEEIGKATVVAMDLQDDNVETEDETYQVNMVMDEEMDHGWSKVVMTVDSGADISVLPEEFAGVGEEAHGGGRQIIMKDAQGNIIQQSGTRKVNFAMMGKDGIPVNFVEKFILGKVKHPILCAGRLLRSGWEMRRSEDGLNLWHKQGWRSHWK